MRHSRLLRLTPVLILLGCGAGAGGTSDHGPVWTLGSNELTAAELAVRDYESAFDAVRALRPNWLRQRGRASLTRQAASQVVVYLDGTRVGGPDYLRQLRASDVAVMEYLNAADATNRYGTGHVGGAIVVRTHSG